MVASDLAKSISKEQRVTDVFISYGRQSPDSDHAKQMYQWLRDREINVFLDTSGLTPGEPYPKEIDQALRAASVVLSLWSNYSVQREWVQKECEKAKRRKTLLPIAIEKLDLDALPTSLELIQTVPLDAVNEASFADVFERHIQPRLKKPMPSDEPEAKPIIERPTSSQAINLRSVIDDINGGRIVIPEYQRESNQWTRIQKSLLIESVLNNFALPAFFFERREVSGRQVREVVDGQQRLGALREFKDASLRLCDEDEGEYLPSAAAYAGKTYAELPQAFRDAFDDFTLTVIELQNLGASRLEVFRRINYGGTPLSPHDVRLASFLDGSGCVRLIKDVGSSIAGWNAEPLLVWRDYWSAKSGNSAGQQASAMFFWSVVARWHEKFDAALHNLDVGSHMSYATDTEHPKGTEEVLDAFCEMLQYYDRHPDVERPVPKIEDLKEYFDNFQILVRRSLGHMTRERARFYAISVGSVISLERDVENWSDAQVSRLIEFVNGPKDFASKYSVDWPQSRGTWATQRGTGPRSLRHGKY
jgi:hypothetical protein